MDRQTKLSNPKQNSSKEKGDQNFPFQGGNQNHPSNHVPQGGDNFKVDQKLRANLQHQAIGQNEVEEYDEDLNEDRFVQRQQRIQGAHHTDEEEQQNQQNSEKDFQQDEYENEEGEQGGEEEGQEQEEGEEEEEYSELNREQLVCLKCQQQVDQALVLQCGHRLCLDCAAIQYRLALSNSGISPHSQQLINTLDCEICQVSTPLTFESIKVLLSFHEDQNENENNNSDQYYNQQEQTNESNLEEQEQEEEEQEDEVQLEITEEELQKQNNEIQRKSQELQAYYQPGQKIEEIEEFEQSQGSQQPEESYNQNDRNLTPSQYKKTLQSQTQQFNLPTQDNQSLSQSKSKNSAVHSKNSSQPQFSPHFVPASPESEDIRSSAHNIGQQQKQLQVKQINYQPPNDSPFQVKQQNQQPHSSLHKKVISNSSSNKISINNNNNNNINNNDLRILYCFSCQTQCFTLEEYLKGLHKNHNVKNVSKSYEELQDPIEELLQAIRSNNDILVQNENKLTIKQSELKDKLSECKEQIKQNFQELAQALKNKEQQLLLGVDEATNEKAIQINKCKENVQQNINLLLEYQNNLNEVYYNSQRQVENEIQAFDYFANHKKQIQEKIQENKGQLFQQVNEKLNWQINVDHNSILSHIDSLKQVKLEIQKLRIFDGIAHNPSTPMGQKKSRLFERKSVEKSMKQLDYPLFNTQERYTQEAEDQMTHTSSVQSNFQSYNPINYISLANKEKLSQIIQHSSSTENISAQEPLSLNYLRSKNAQNSSPSKYIRLSNPSPPSYIKMREQFSRSNNKLQVGNQTLDDLYPQSLSQRMPFRSQNSLTFSNSNPKTSKKKDLSSFKTFSIHSSNARQEFTNILQSPSTFVKILPLTAIDHLVLPQQGSKNIPKNSYSIHSTSQTKSTSMLDAFRKNIEEMRKVTLGNEDSTSSRGSLTSNLSNHPTSSQLASTAALNRIRHLQDKFSTKF